MSDYEDRITEHAECDILQSPLGTVVGIPSGRAHSYSEYMSDTAEAAREVRAEAIKKEKIWLPGIYYSIMAMKKHISPADKKLALAEIREISRKKKWMSPTYMWEKSDAYTQLMNAFRWSETKQGFAFWQQLAIIFAAKH